jgi:hypothetical protein
MAHRSSSCNGSGVIRADTGETFEQIATDKP